MTRTRCLSAPLEARSIRRIAIFRALHLGDLLLAVPAFRSIRAGFPEAEITLIGLPWARSFAERFSRHIDRFVEFAGYPGIDEVKLDAGRVEAFLAEQRAYRYDLAIQMHGSGRTSNRFVLDLGATDVAVYYDREPVSGCVASAPYPHDEPELCRNLKLARLLGCPDRGVALEFPLSRQDRDEASRLLSRLPEDGRTVMGVHPGSRSPARRWPARRFAAVADYFARRHGARVVVTGGPGEEETVRDVVRAMECSGLDLAGATSLGALAAIIERLDLFISNDTGPAHLAEAVGTPSVRIFGPADPHRWAPLDARLHPIVHHPVPCSPCPYTLCPIDHRCLRWVDEDAVIRAAAGLLPKRSAA